jgi:hypothetical protein
LRKRLIRTRKWVQNGTSKHKEKNLFWSLASNFHDFNEKINTVKNSEFYADFNAAEKVAKFMRKKVESHSNRS